tara:strand:+ start:2262 stop:2522 length:261 start_codon:yes stop_codon:yes gene_type:complete
MFKLFTDHPQSVGESYIAHLGMAFSFGSRMFVVSLACLLHGIFPFLFVKTGSKLVASLHREMVTHRDRRDPRPADAQDQHDLLAAE